MKDNVRPCIQYKDPMDCDKESCIGCRLFGTAPKEEEVDFDEKYDVYQHDLNTMEPGHYMTFPEPEPPIDLGPESEPRQCQVCGKVVYEESHCNEMTGMVEYIPVEVVYGCGHRGSKLTTIDDAGPDISMASSELCPSCQQKLDDEQADLWERDNISCDSEY